jgi:hypothetical protein
MKFKKIKKKFKKNILKEWDDILFNILFIFLSILIVILLYERILIVNILLIIISIIGLLKWKSKLSLIVFILFGLMFGIAEILVSFLGPWKYGSADIVNIPSWLFILWGNTAVFIHQMIREIKKFGIK